MAADFLQFQHGVEAKAVARLPYMGCSRSFGIRSGEVTVILCSDANGLAAGFGASMDTAEIARYPESLEDARLARGFDQPGPASGISPILTAISHLARRQHYPSFDSGGVRYLTPTGGASEYELMLSLQANGNIIPNIQSNLTIVTSLVFNYLTSGRNEPSIKAHSGLLCLYKKGKK